MSKDWSRLAHIGGNKCKGELGGLIDDFRIYNYALNSTEVFDVMNDCYFQEKGPDVKTTLGNQKNFKVLLNSPEETDVKWRYNEKRNYIRNATDNKSSNSNVQNFQNSNFL